MKKGSVFKYPELFWCDNGSEFKSDVTICLKNMLVLEEEQQNTSIPTKPLRRPLRKS